MCKNIVSFLKLAALVILILGIFNLFGLKFVTGLIVAVIIWVIAVVIGKQAGVCKKSAKQIPARPVRKAIKRKPKKKKTAKKKKKR